MKTNKVFHTGGRNVLFLYAFTVVSVLLYIVFMSVPDPRGLRLILEFKMKISTQTNPYTN